MARAARLDWLAKAGFAARGVVYILFGWIALSARGDAEEGQSAVFDSVHDMPAGNLLLTAIAIGLLAYGVFRIVCALLDIEGKGSDAKGLLGRTSQFVSGIVHLALAWTATKFIDGKQAGDSQGDQGSEAAARTLLDFELGDFGLWLVAAGFFFAAALQVRKAWKGSHMKQCAADTPHAAKTIGQIGLVTRGLIFAVVGYSFVEVAQSHSAGEAKALGSAVVSLRDNATLYTAVAVGLILFGVFSLLLARYRIVPAIDVLDAAKGGARSAWR